MHSEVIKMRKIFSLWRQLTYTVQFSAYCEDLFSDSVHLLSNLSTVFLFVLTQTNKRQAAHLIGGRGFFLACEDVGENVRPFPACAFFFWGEGGGGR